MISRKSALLQLRWQVHTCKCLLVLHLQGDGCFYWLGYHSCCLKIDQWTVLKPLADSIRNGDRRMPLALCSLKPLSGYTRRDQSCYEHMADAIESKASEVWGTILRLGTLNLSWLALFANRQSLGHPDSPSPDLIRALNIDRASTVCLGSWAASFWAHVAVAKPVKA